eukprot:TRINITY_DN33070_c0_g1_i1.p1 TRINITY_DN33070_c0_g1~~TRINITY_DN33070_c0_g1_i1.p1  ORF type:complete len:449 (-),score=146.85 TRINITY_DN33070_c0_g1_i1:80-1426(-)
MFEDDEEPGSGKSQAAGGIGREKADTVHQPAPQHQQQQHHSFSSIFQNEKLLENIKPDELARVRAMIQAISMFEQQLRQNDRLIHDFQEQIAGKERACERLRRRAQHANHQTQQTNSKVASWEDEIQKLKCKADQHLNEANDEALATLHEKLRETKDQIAKTESEMPKLQSELNTLQAKIRTKQAQAQEQQTHLDKLRQTYRHELEQIQQCCSTEADCDRCGHAAELEQIMSQKELEMQELKKKHCEEIKELQKAKAAAEDQKKAYEESRNEAMEELVSRQKEGHGLQQLCTAARQEALELSSEVRTLLASKPDGGILDDLLELAEEELGDDFEIVELRRRCYELERERARAQEAEIQTPRPTSGSHIGLEWEESEYIAKFEEEEIKQLQAHLTKEFEANARDEDDAADVISLNERGSSSDSERKNDIQQRDAEEKESDLGVFVLGDD